MNFKAMQESLRQILLQRMHCGALTGVGLAQQVLAVLKFKKSFLRKMKRETDVSRSTWHRFVLIRLGARDAFAMAPRLAVRATLLIDRHYTSLKPYRKGDSNMYAVVKNDSC